VILSRLGFTLRIRIWKQIWEKNYSVWT
jgi:hypothetical protein